MLEAGFAQKALGDLQLVLAARPRLDGKRRLAGKKA